VGVPRLNAALIAATLDEEAIEIVAVSDARVALERARRSDFGICLLDLDQLGPLARGLVGALSEQDERLLAIGVGANRYGADVDAMLSRPYSPDDLVMVVRAMLGEDLRSVPSTFAG
jgi:DNA-binding response OmpR family regulator